VAALKFLADENFDGKLLNALKRRIPALDIVRVQDVGLMETPDEQILGWAATAGRLLLSHDLDTVPGFAKERVRAGLPMPGVVVMRNQIGTRAIDDLELLALGSQENEWEGQIVYIPLR
jgi:predicted nuclease of predicted toxin-antitoxin system